MPDTRATAEIPEQNERQVVMKTVRTPFSALLAVLLTIQPVSAWSECGHHIIAILAFDQLKPEERQQVLNLLGKHPRYSDDLSGLRVYSSQLDYDHWIIGQAGYWPDVARNQPEFNRPNWHYQLGSSLTIGEIVRVPETPGALPPDAHGRVR